MLMGFLRLQTKMALIVRADLKLSKGKTGSQCAHAAVIAFARAQKDKRVPCAAWLAQGQPKIVLKVDSLEALAELRERAEQADIVVGEVRDAGRTQIPAGTVTVLGIGPDYVDKVDQIVKHLKLL